MDDLEQELTIKIYNDTNAFFEINTKDLNINLEQIKKECKEKFKYEEKDIEKMDLWYIDEDNDKNLINNENELMLYAEEMDSSKYFINLNLELTKKKDKKEENIIEEGKKKDKEKEEKYYNDELEQKNNLIVKLQKENAFLNSQLKYHKDRNKKIILKYEEILDKNRLKNLDEKKDDLNNNDKENNEINNDIDNNYINNKDNIKDNFNDNINDNNIQNIFDFETSPVQNEGKNLQVTNSLNSETEIKIPLNNKKINKFKENGKEYNLKELEFINNRCKKCFQRTIKSIYKCIICIDYFLCETCYKTITKNKIHEHIEFFHIIYPNEVASQLEKKEKDNIKLNNAVNAFYGFLNKYFFDKNGNIIVKEINNKDIGKINTNLNKICKDMINVNLYPLDYFSAYQKCYINIAMKNMEEKDKEIITKNVMIFTNNIKNFSVE